MKKILALLLALALVFTLAACAKKTETPAPEAAPETAETQSEAQPQTAAPTPLTVTIEDHAEELKDEAGTALGAVKWQTVSVAEGGPVQEALDAFNKTIDDEIHALLKELAETKANDRVTAPDMANVAYESVETITVLRADTNVVSLLRGGYQYFGGAHGSPYMTTLNIDGTTGKPLVLSEVFTGDLVTPVMEKLKAEKDENGLFDGWEDMAQKYLAGQSESAQCWTLDNNGLTILFPVYEIAPYAAGVISVVLPYADYPESFAASLTETAVSAEAAPASEAAPAETAPAESAPAAEAPAETAPAAPADGPVQESNELPIC